ncbi:MAG: hypothetical protein H0W19_09335 [Nitrosopumilus sp.]|nr:hypothetical protein [Nitrosopumilus sp.]
MVRKTRGLSNQSTKSTSFTNHKKNTLGISGASEIFLNSLRKYSNYRENALKN